MPLPTIEEETNEDVEIIEISCGEEDIQNVTTEDVKIFDSQLEPLLRIDPHRYALFSIEYPNIWCLYKKAMASFWTVKEVDLSKDLKNWKLLKNHERQFISYILTHVASGSIVNNNLVEHFCQQVQLTEARCFNTFQVAMKNVHSEMYSLLLKTYIYDPYQRDCIYDTLSKMPWMRKKANWIQKWIKSKESTFAERTVAFACMEGIFFSGSFATLFWLKMRGVLPGLTFVNDLISRDKRLHCEYFCLMFTYIVQKPNPARILEIVCDAVAIELEFLTAAMPVHLLGIRCNLMAQYIQFVADRILLDMNCDRFYHATNPFNFIKMISYPE